LLRAWRDASTDGIMPTAFFKVVGSRIRLFTLAVMIEVGRSNDREKDTPGEAFRAIDELARQKKGREEGSDRYFGDLRRPGLEHAYLAEFSGHPEGVRSGRIRRGPEVVAVACAEICRCAGYQYGCV